MALSHYQDSKSNMLCREGSALMTPKGHNIEGTNELGICYLESDVV